MRNALMNEAKTINSEYAKKRKRYQSILVADAKSFNDFGSRLNTSKEHSILKKKNNIKTNQRLSVFQILQKRGINPTFHENLYTDSNESFNKKRVKFSSRFSVVHNQNNNVLSLSPESKRPYQVFPSLWQECNPQPRQHW